MIDILILCLFINWDKEDIICLVCEIGMEDFVKIMFEFCGVILKSLIVKVVKEKLEEEEVKFDFVLFD